MARLRESKEMALFAVSSVLLLAGGVAWLLAAGTPARVLWIAGTVLGLVFVGVLGSRRDPAPPAER